MQWRKDKPLIIPFLILLFWFSSCAPAPTFEQLAQQYRVDYSRQFASDDTATLTIFTPQKVKADLAFCDKYLDRFNQVQNGDFPFDDRQSLAQLTTQLQDKQNRIKTYLTFPDRYDIRRPIERILAAEGETLEAKLKVVEKQLSLTKRYYAAAKDNLKSVQPDAAKNAVRLHQRTYQLLDRELPELVALTSWNSLQQQQFLRYAEVAKIAVKDYIGYCRSLSRLPT
ncbi:MAG: hypothetical protein AB8G22_15880 [Saprospiraceae bacterium]